jgi:IS5 family transposase
MKTGNYFNQPQNMYKSQAQFQNSFLGNFAYREIIDRHQDNILVKLNKLVDLSFIEPLVSDCYSQDWGASAYHPVMMFKILFLQTWADRSDREIMDDVDTNILYRWFAGLPMNEAAPHWTLLGKFRERLGSDRFDQIFAKIVGLAQSVGLVIGKTRIIDCSAVKANVDISRCSKKKSGNDDSGYIDRNSPDPDASIGHKSEKESWYGYNSGILIEPDSEIVTSVTTQTAAPHDVNHLESLVDQDIATTGGFKRLGGDKGFVGRTEFLKSRGIVDNIIRKCNMVIPRRKSYFADKLKRPIIERKFSEGKNRHHLGKARYWGKLKVHIQCLMVYLTTNLKKIVNFLSKQAAKI